MPSTWSHNEPLAHVSDGNVVFDYVRGGRGISNRFRSHSRLASCEAQSAARNHSWVGVPILFNDCGTQHFTEMDNQ